MKGCGKNYAAVLKGERDINILHLNDPALCAHQVRVAVKTSAICGTQIGEWTMSRGPDPHLPHCFGHEAVGEVLEVGEEVSGLLVGDRVIISWMKASADCHEPPKFTEESGADVNFGQCCTFVTRGVFPENRVFKIDESIATDIAALLGCALLTAHAALKCATSASKGEKSEIAIVGSGGIGLSVAALCQALGWSAICVDTPAVITHLEMQDLGFQFTSTDEATAQRAGKHQIVIVCTGAHSAFELAETLLTKNAGKLLVVGNPPYGTKVGLDIKPLLYGREIIGVGEKDVELPKDLYELVDLLKAGRLQAERLVRQRFPLADIQAAFEASDSGLGGRTLIDIG